MSRRMTVRGIPDGVADRLERLSTARAQSLDRTVNQILAEAVGVDERRMRLQRYAVWTQEELAEFDEALASQRTIDAEVWR